MRKIFVPQLDAKEVTAVLRKHGYKLPSNCRPLSEIASWFRGRYYSYGAKDLWIPLNSMGGMATRPFDSHTVRFPKRIDQKLLKMLERKRRMVIDAIFQGDQ